MIQMPISGVTLGVPVMLGKSVTYYLNYMINQLHSKMVLI